MAQEILTFDEQVWLARHFGLQDRPHLLAVEQFMQQYYRHTMGLHELCIRFVDRCRSVPFWQRLARFFPAPRVDEYFVVRGEVCSRSPTKCGTRCWTVRHCCFGCSISRGQAI